MSLLIVSIQVVAPKKIRLAEAEESLATTMKLLNTKRQELAEVEAKLANLKAQFQETTEKKEQLEFQVCSLSFTNNAKYIKIHWKKPPTSIICK